MALASMCRWIPTLLKACCNTSRHRTVLERSSGCRPGCLVVRNALMLVPGLLHCWDKHHSLRAWAAR